MQRLGGAFLQQFVATPRSAAQYCVDNSTPRFWRKLDGLVNGGVLRRIRKQKLIKAELQNVAKIDIHTRGAKFPDPKIKEREIPQSAVKKFQGEGAIGLRKAFSIEK